MTDCKSPVPAPSLLLNTVSRHMMKIFSVKLYELPSGNDQWVFTVNLERMKEQPELEQALRHPTAEELEVWDQYLLEKEKMVKAFAETHGANKAGTILEWLPVE